MAKEEKQKGTEVAVRKEPSVRALTPFEEMEQLFESFFPRRGWMRPLWERPMWGEMMATMEARFPKMDVVDRESEIVVRAEIPGLSKDEIEVSLMGEDLVIKGASRHEKVADEKGRYHRREISSQSFERCITLPAAVDAEKATSSFKDGVLELILPKREKVKQHKIAIG
ncbi:Hsp20/alpha crystallin family protein [Thiofaba sp. EF100]|jgi:HSP20 family protein|uniref:Hsp20/alpha crystallin family protein n=1 Tax=Thiofaba sp. EF100 TaxID=3121274 RepID=UPI00322199A5